MTENRKPAQLDEIVSLARKSIKESFQRDGFRFILPALAAGQILFQYYERLNDFVKYETEITNFDPYYKHFSIKKENLKSLDVNWVRHGKRYKNCLLKTEQIKIGLNA